MLSRRPLLRTALALALASAAAPAQSVTWLTPREWSAAAGGFGRLDVETERAGASVQRLWKDVEHDWFFVRSAGEQQNLDAVAPRTGEDFVRVDLASAGAALIGMNRRERVERIPGAELLSFLTERTANGELAAGWRARAERSEQRVRRVESAKLLLLATDANGEAPRNQSATSKAGQPCEIRPLLDPTAVSPGGDLPVRVYLPGGAGPVTFLARHEPSGRVQTATTDERGIGHFALDRAGVWSLEAHRAVELTGDPEADWELRSATLRFRVAREGR